MPRKTEYEKRNVKGEGDWQYYLGVRPHSGKRKAKRPERIAVQKVADKDDAPERHPRVGISELPAPDVSYNASVNQYYFQGGIDWQPGMRGTSRLNIID
jgi:hypothetical protein